MDIQQSYKVYSLVKAQFFYEELHTDLMMLKTEDYLYLSDEEDCRRVKVPTGILKAAIELYMVECQNRINKYKSEIEKL